MNARRWTVAEVLVFRAVHSPLLRWMWVRLLRTCFGFELVGAERVPRERAVIFAGNHASHYDGLFSVTAAWLVQRRVPVAVGWGGLRDFPVTKQMISTGALELVLTDDGEPDSRQAGVILGTMIDRLEAGRSVVVHAEGHRRDALDEFMQGAAVAAVSARVPIVPFTLRGVHGLWRELPRPDRWRGQVSVIFHPLLEPAGYAGLSLRESASAMTAELRRRVASAIDYPDALATPEVSDPRG
jgi:1-acyl-sn-glycerol-3-phosphate acyltransferase